MFRFFFFVEKFEHKDEQGSRSFRTTGLSDLRAIFRMRPKRSSACLRIAPRPSLGLKSRRVCEGTPVDCCGHSCAPSGKLANQSGRSFGNYVSISPKKIAVLSILIIDSRVRRYSCDDVVRRSASLDVFPFYDRERSPSRRNNWHCTT